MKSTTATADSAPATPAVRWAMPLYSGIQRVRFKDRLTTRTYIAPDTLDFWVANADGTTATAGLGTYIDCNGVSRTATDRFVRRAYVTTIQLRNMRPGLPSDYVSGEDPWAFLYEN